MLHSRLLRYLDEVARCGSIRKAADNLHVASSAISRQIIALERELRTPLFERLPKKILLTSAGEVVINHVRETLRNHQRVLAQLDDLRGARNTMASIATGGLAADLLSGALTKFRSEHPLSGFSIKVLSSHDILAAVVSGEADLGFAFDLPPAPQVSVAASIATSFGAVVPAGHPLALQDSVRLFDLHSYPLILPTAEVKIRIFFEQACARANLTLKPTYESNNFEFMKRLVVMDQGVAVLNRIDVVDLHRRGLVNFIPLAEPTHGIQSLMVVQRSSGDLEPLPRLVLEMLKELLADLDRAERIA